MDEQKDRRILRKVSLGALVAGATLTLVPLAISISHDLYNIPEIINTNQDYIIRGIFALGTIPGVIGAFGYRMSLE